MTKIIVFSGNSNTGKTTAINFLYEKFVTEYPNKKVVKMHESAREFINQQEGGIIKDVHEFETFIIQEESKRLQDLKDIKEHNTYDFVFIDRTWLDAIIYSYWNLINGNINRIDYVHDYHQILTTGRDLYDRVIFFTTPIKIDKRFPIYNNEHINAVFEHSVRFRYGDKVIIYTNNIFFQDNLESTIFGNIFEL